MHAIRGHQHQYDQHVSIINNINTAASQMYV